MKRVRIDIKEDSPGRKFWIFGSSADLWDWVQECFRDPNEAIADVPEGAHEITLNPGSFLEAEWWGCEVMQEGTGWRHLNLVRMGEARPSDNDSGNVVTIHVGWVIDTIIPLRDYEDENITVYRIDGADDAVLDLDDLFRQRGIEL